MSFQVSYVMRLVRKLPQMWYKGHILYADNYYGSEALLEALSEVGVHSVMTVNAPALRQHRLIITNSHTHDNP